MTGKTDNRKEFFLIVTGLAAGFIFRLILITFVPQPLVHDQLQYRDFAIGIANNGLFAQTYRLYGYPILIAPFFLLFGPDAKWSIYIFQIIMDIATGSLVYLTGKKIFKNRAAAFTGFILYQINPFTATYSGLMLTETAAIFFTALIFYLLVSFWKKLTLVKLSIITILTGYLVQVRSTNLYFALMILPFIIYKSMSIIDSFRWKAAAIIAGIFFFFLPFVYNIFGNLKYFNQFSLMTVDNFFVQQLYLSLYVDRWPLHPTENSSYPYQVGQIYSEFSFAPKDKEERKEMAEKYLKLSLSEIESKPVFYLKRALLKMWYIFDKETLYYFTEPENKTLSVFLLWLNRTILFSAAAGLLGFIIRLKKTKSETALIFVSGITLMTGYYALVHVLSVSEQRFSLPLYPYVLMFAGYFFYIIRHTYFFPRKNHKF